MIPVLWGVLTITFFLSRLAPGDPAEAMAGQRATEAQKQAIREHYGFDQPLLMQYGKYMFRVLQGDLGLSYDSHRPVTGIILEKFPNTARLAVSAMMIAIILGISAGMLSALLPNTWVDRVTMVFALLGISTPVFWLGLLLIYFFSIELQWLPPSGYGNGGIAYLVLPAIALGTQSVAFLARMTRASMLEIMGEQYITSARARGVSEFSLIGKHAFFNAIIPIITILGMDFASYLSGSVLIRRFSDGLQAVTAISQRDYPLINGIVIFSL